MLRSGIDTKPGSAPAICITSGAHAEVRRKSTGHVGQHGKDGKPATSRKRAFIDTKIIGIDMSNSIWSTFYEPHIATTKAMKSSVLMAIVRRHRDSGESQAAMSKRLGLSQPRVSDLLTGKVDKFSLEALIQIAVKSGVGVTLNTSSSPDA